MVNFDLFSIRQIYHASYINTILYIKNSITLYSGPYAKMW